MAIKKKQLIVNLLVVALGLFVGIANLIKWYNDQSLIRSLVLGLICMGLATGWLVYTIKNK